MAGKGSFQRPTDHKKFSENYDVIFNKNKNKASELKTNKDRQNKTQEDSTK